MTSSRREDPQTFWLTSNRAWEERLIDLAIDDDGGGEALLELLRRMPVITTPGLEYRAMMLVRTCRTNGSLVVVPTLHEICSGGRQRKRDLRTSALGTLVTLVGEAGSLEEVLAAYADRDHRYVEFAGVLLEFFDDPQLAAPLATWVRDRLATKRTRSRSRFLACAFVALRRMTRDDPSPKLHLGLDDGLVAGMTDLERSAWRGAWRGHELTYPTIRWPDGH